MALWMSSNGPRKRFEKWYAQEAGEVKGRQFAAQTPVQKWAEVMGWLDGLGLWEPEERGGMLAAVLDMVSDVEKIPT